MKATKKTILASQTENETERQQVIRMHKSVYIELMKCNNVKASPEVIRDIQAYHPALIIERVASGEYCLSDKIKELWQNRANAYAGETLRPFVWNEKTLTHSELYHKFKVGEEGAVIYDTFDLIVTAADFDRLELLKIDAAKAGAYPVPFEITGYYKDGRVKHITADGQGERISEAMELTVDGVAGCIHTGVYYWVKRNIERAEISLPLEGLKAVRVLYFGNYSML